MPVLERASASYPDKTRQRAIQTSSASSLGGSVSMTPHDASNRNRLLNEAFSHEQNCDIIWALRDIICYKYPPTNDYDLSRYAPAERILLCVYWLYEEVGNGGFHQYFFNSAGDNALETLQALQTIGATAGVELFKKVLAMFPKEKPPTERTKRHPRLKEIWDERVATLLPLDEEYYAKEEGIFALAVKYLRVHQADFL
jgi:hypothetical protein